MTVARSIAEPIIALRPDMNHVEREERVREVMAQVGLSEELINRYPHELSGGQNQRVGIARAIVLKPRLVVCDEAVSALDVSIQAQVVNLLSDLQKQFGLAMLFISHDLKLVSYLAHEVAVMYLGVIVEQAEPEALYGDPSHPYTRALLAAVPDPRRKGERPLLAGEPPNPAARPTGCVFHPRCPIAIDKCRTVVPELSPGTAGRLVACHLAPRDMAPLKTVS